MTWPDLKVATWRQKALYPVTSLLSFPVPSEVLLSNEYILHSKWQMASIKKRSLGKHSRCWVNDPTVLLIYSFRPLELICQFCKLNVSVWIMKKDAWELHRLGTRAVPVLRMRWEARAGEGWDLERCTSERIIGIYRTEALPLLRLHNCYRSCVL